MSLRNNPNKGNNIGTTGNTASSITTKRVIDIILDSSHPAYTSDNDIGVIFYADVDTKENYNNPLNLPIAYPKSGQSFDFPLLQELVLIEGHNSPNHYEDLGGDNDNIRAYYSPALNIHNNNTSNALPLGQRIKNKIKTSKTESQVKNFELQKEFKSDQKEKAKNQLNRYLNSLGYNGIDDNNAPKYSYSVDTEGNHIFKLDDPNEGTRLGEYFKEKSFLKKLRPGEGDSIREGRGGQRLHFFKTGPRGSNILSKDVTDIPDDGNPNIGDPAIALSLGSGDQENITDDAASLYLLANQSLPIDASSVNIDSLKSEYIPPLKPLEAISKPPITPIPSPLPEAELEINPTNFDFSTFNSPEDNTPLVVSESIEMEIEDPVFAALDESIEEGLLEEMGEEDDDVSGTELDPEVESGIDDDDEIQGNDGFNFDGEVDEDLNIIYQNYNMNEAVANWKNSNSNYASSEYRRKNYVSLCSKGRDAWTNGDYANAMMVNKKGKIIAMPPPDPGTFMLQPAKNKNVEYIVIHCTAGWNRRNPGDTMNGFFEGRNWETGGYHWLVMNDGKATRMYPDDVKVNGAKGINYKAIHLNWIGGFNSSKNAENKKIQSQYGIDSEEKARRLYGFGQYIPSPGTPANEGYMNSSNFSGYYPDYELDPSSRKPEFRNVNLPSLNQMFTLVRLLKKYSELYPNAKIVGHNQGTTKPCPLFDVPYFCELMGINPNTTLDHTFHTSRYGTLDFATENSKILANALLNPQQPGPGEQLT